MPAWRLCDMTTVPIEVNRPVILQSQHLQTLIEALSRRSYQVVGPVVANGAIVYDEISSAKELPIGWTDEQKGGSYRLVKKGHSVVFGFVVGPQSWKKFLHPPEVRLWGAKRNGSGFHIETTSAEPPKFAFFGVRACELRALEIQDKVFIKGDFQDPTYRSRREHTFIIAVNCTEVGGTCFCKSTESGPAAHDGFDLALTEIVAKDRHDFVVRIGTQRGAEVLTSIPHKEATQEEIEKADHALAEAAKKMGRQLDTTDIKSLLYRNYENPRWDETSDRCLNCANCTMVCPTCFCTTVEDVTDLTGTHAERWRKWDSCFTTDFSYIHGGSIRVSRKSRYRQWLTHKLATWIDQFGTLGCVGCGRCITWCPVAIDLTEEVRAIRESERGDSAASIVKEKNDGNS